MPVQELAMTRGRGLTAEPWVTIELKDGHAFLDGARVDHPGTLDDRYRAAVDRVAAEVATPLGRLVGVTVKRAEGPVDHLAVHPDGDAALIEELVRASLAPPIVPRPRVPGDDVIESYHRPMPSREPKSKPTPAQDSVRLARARAIAKQAPARPAPPRRPAARPVQPARPPAKEAPKKETPKKRPAPPTAKVERPEAAPPERPAAKKQRPAVPPQAAAPKVEAEAKAAPVKPATTRKSTAPKRRKTTSKVTAPVKQPAPAPSPEPISPSRTSGRLVALGVIALIVAVAVAIAGAVLLSGAEAAERSTDALPPLAAPAGTEKGSGVHVPASQPTGVLWADVHPGERELTIEATGTVQPLEIRFEIVDAEGQPRFARRTFLDDRLVVVIPNLPPGPTEVIVGADRSQNLPFEVTVLP